MKTIATCFALLCAWTAALRADTVLIYDTASSSRVHGLGTTSVQTARYYLLFDYTTSKTAVVTYSGTGSRKRYNVGTFDNDDFLRFFVRTSATASATYFHIANDLIGPGGARQLAYVFMDGANKLMDLGGGHTGNFPARVSGIIRGFAAAAGADQGAFTGKLTLRLVPALTIAANTSDASLEASIQIVTADLERRGYLP